MVKSPSDQPRWPPLLQLLLWKPPPAAHTQADLPACAWAWVYGWVRGEFGEGPTDFTVCSTGVTRYYEAPHKVLLSISVEESAYQMFRDHLSHPFAHSARRAENEDAVACRVRAKKKKLSNDISLALVLSQTHLKRIGLEEQGINDLMALREISQILQACSLHLVLMHSSVGRVLAGGANSKHSQCCRAESSTGCWQPPAAVVSFAMSATHSGSLCAHAGLGGCSVRTQFRCLSSKRPPSCVCVHEGIACVHDNAYVCHHTHAQRSFSKK